MSIANELNVGEPTIITQVEILVEMDHKFVKKQGTKHVCGICGQQRLMPVHGAVSYQGSGRALDNKFTYQSTNMAWRALYLKHLAPLEIPKPCAKIEVFGQICFPNHIERDEGNHRFTIEKFFGDALQDGGYLTKDDWTRYRFRDLDLAPSEPGRQWTRLLLACYL